LLKYLVIIGKFLLIFDCNWFPIEELSIFQLFLKILSYFGIGRDCISNFVMLIQILDFGIIRPLILHNCNLLNNFQRRRNQLIL